MDRILINKTGSTNKERRGFDLQLYSPDQQIMADIVVGIVNQFCEQTIDPAGLYILSMAIAGLGRVPGDIVEVGVYRGRSAATMLETSLVTIGHEKHFHLFDTFTGVPDKSFRGSKQSKKPGFVRHEYLRPYAGRFTTHKGIFPEETGSVLNGKGVSFAHIDVDTHEYTLKALDFLYPKMNKGGIFLVHDYSFIQNVRNSVLEFCRANALPCFELGASYGMIVT